jgi:hypothetical protein
MMLLVGILGFFYATSQMEEAEPVPPGISLSEYTRYTAGRWELARYALAAVGGIGALFALFPEGR